jgi:acyl-CoA dehydrogenase
LPKARPEQLLDQAGEIGVLTADEQRLVRDAEAARLEAITVDSFTLDEYLRKQPAAAVTAAALHG